MNILEMYVHEDHSFDNLDSISESGNEFYRNSIHRQRIQRQSDGRNKLKTNYSAYHKRRNDHMLSENNSHVIVQLHELRIHQHFDTLISN